MSTSARGNGAENRVANHGREQGFLVGSLRHEAGAGDQVWRHPRQRGRLVEVKAGQSPWKNFTRADRKALIARAAQYDLDPLLAYCPAPSKPIVWLLPSDWPS